MPGPIFSFRGNIAAWPSVISTTTAGWMRWLQTSHNITSNAGHWLALRLTGTRSNRDGIGAKVAVTLASGRKLYNPKFQKVPESILLICDEIAQGSICGYWERPN